MRRRKSLFFGIVLLLLANCVVTLPEWAFPYFVEPDETEEVTWYHDDERPSSVSVTIWEGVTTDIMLTRLTFQPDETNTIPTLSYSGARGLGMEIEMDTDPEYPVYVKATEPGDYESGSTNFVVLLTPPNSLQSTARYVMVTLENINDNPPVMTGPPNCAFEETLTHDGDDWESNCEFTVTDLDGGACYVEITIDDPHFKMRLKSTQTYMCTSATFLLGVKEPLDYETSQLHSLHIVVQDNGKIGSGPEDKIQGEPQTQELTYIVNVIDMPDEPPVWQTLRPYISMDEKSESQTQFLARDGDYGLDWDIEYTLEFSDEDQEFAEYFLMDKNTGMFTVKHIDRDTIKREVFNVIVVATEVPEDQPEEFVALDIKNPVVVMVNDINDHEPKIEPETQFLEVKEEQPFTFKDFIVFDPDLGENGQYELKLEPNDFPWNENFQLIPSSGYQSSDITVTALDPSKLDYEVEDWRIITLTIVAEEVADKTHVGIATLTIQLINEFDEPPEFDESVCDNVVEFEENQKEGYKVVHAKATDPDEGDVITYTLNMKYMTIDGDGVVTSTNDNAFDYERQPEMVLQVMAEDLGKLRAYCVVNIELIDINDEPPSLIMPYNSNEILEHSDPGTRASDDITATDPDTKAELEFQIDWSSSMAYKQGIRVGDDDLYKSSVELSDTIRDGDEWSTHLEILDSLKFDWEVFDTLRLQISVIDKNTHEDYEINKKRSAIMTVIVGDINDCPPVFTTDNAEFSVNENMPLGHNIGAVIATDDDGPGHNEISYFIEPLSPEELVAVKDVPRVTINKVTGQIYATETEIDCDEWQSLVFKYTVTATDGELDASTTVTLNILDVNDNSPKITNPEDPHEIEEEFEEHKPGRWPVACILGVDIDVTENYHTITYYIEGTARNLFEMEEDCEPRTKCCLFAKDGNELDREKEPSHEIQVYSRDNYKLGIKDNSNEGPVIKISVILIDINDNPPVFEERDTPFEVREIIETSQNLFKVTVTDEDIGLNAVFTCEENPEVQITFPERPDESYDGLFKVETEVDGCVVKATKSLRGLWGDYTFKLTAHDQGEPGQLSNPGHGTYTLVVANDNLNPPVITSPESGTSILIGRDQALNSTNPLVDLNGNSVRDFTATDEDDPRTLNGQTYFTWTGGENIFYLDPSPMINTAVLRMYRIPNFGERQFTMTVVATDRAEIGSLSSQTVNFVVWVLNSDSYPEFTDLEPAIVYFEENEGGLEKTETLRAAVNLDEEPLEENERRDIYYYIIDGDQDIFQLDKTTRELSLLVMLDYETVTEYTLKIFASHDPENPDLEKVNSVNVLEVIVHVIDVNDMPPQFSQDLFAGTFSNDQRIGQRILELEAYDPDVDDIVTFSMIPGTITASHNSLQEFVSDESFIVERLTGLITLNFSPNGRDLSGYFEFGVQAYDSMGNVEGHRDEALVNVFVVSDTHRVEFNFFNPVSAVETKQRELAAVFTDVLGYTCVVEEVMKDSSENGAETSNVLTHFIDGNNKAPVPSKDIKDQFMDARTYVTLSEEMALIQLSFVGFKEANPNDNEDSHIATIVLAAVSAVMTVLFFVFLLAFIVRTRTLNQRLEKLTKPKFGSQDSGLNRVGMAVPGTNVHALEGSNPVWNHETVIDQMFDNLSQSSGDSDLIGIEDNPYFSHNEAGGINNPAFQPQFGVNSHAMPSAPPPPLDGPRRASVNPLAAAAAAETPGDGYEARSNAGSLAMSMEDVDMPRRISLNPLVSNGNLDLGAGKVNNNPTPMNFSFQIPPGEPATDL